MAWIIPTGKELELSAEGERLLRDLEIDENGPGTILRDFRMLLDFVRKGKVPVTKAQQMTLAPLPEINARMTRPLTLGLKRAVQKSYPHINGLYLLLRASGLTTVEARGKKLFLKVDPDVLASFERLNDVEQYCTLLETWLLRGWPDIILEDDRRYQEIPGNFQGWSFLFHRIPKKGVPFSEDSQIAYVLRYDFSWTNLALLELFGLITVVPGTPGQSKGWCIEHIHRTPLGDALLVLIEGTFFRRFDSFVDLQEEDIASRAGVMQPVLQPYFPAWKHNISIPQQDFREGVHTFRVSLGRVRFQIAIQADDVLDSLAYAILRAVRFDSDHLYQFRYRSRFGMLEAVNHSYMEEGPWTSEIQIGEMEVPVGQPMTFLFDFGDMWEFAVVLEKIEVDRNIPKPVLMEMHGEPPEQYPRYEE